MKILIADDEPLARDRLSHLLEEIDHGFQLSFAQNGIEVIKQVNQTCPDIVLMDIRMPGMDGLEAARHLSEINNPPAVIFTTAYDEYALNAFESQAVDYLLKPIRKEYLQKALHKCTRLNKLQLEKLNEQVPQANSRTHIAAQLRGNILLVPIEDIISFLADHKYTTIQYQKNNIIKETIIEETLKSLEHEFTQDFLRIHRNALIRKDKIESLEKQQDGHVVVHLSHIETGIEVSRRHLAEVRRWLLGAESLNINNSSCRNEK
ncbi:MAG: LytTR family DNA-binding domain-containing protein [gamma proteobacterium symbiont of Taylorina sp.]|nr:LytTR family DNA-binding domain-containing protein [gamma proteobacterium symbiont of Taylorina sp.]